SAPPSSSSLRSIATRNGSVGDRASRWKSAVYLALTFEEGLVEEFDQLMDCACPNCGGANRKMLAIVSFPTLAESHKNWEKLPDIEKDYVVTLEEIREVARSTPPLTVDNLPDI